MGMKFSKPIWIAEPEWNTMDDDQKRRAVSAGPKRKPGSTPSGGATQTAAAPATIDTTTQPMKDIRDWTEDVDGVSGERLRNCIIFQLDYKKDPWFSKRITVSFVRRCAKKLDEDTPLGWTLPDPDPLIIVRTSEFDGEVIERKEIVRRPKNQAERDQLLNLLTDRYGRRNPSIVKWLVDPKCPQCKGRGIYLVRKSNEKGFKFQADQWFDCECVTKKEFKA